jgi:hypothetical protein
VGLLTLTTPVRLRYSEQEQALEDWSRIHYSAEYGRVTISWGIARLNECMRLALPFRRKILRPNTPSPFATVTKGIIIMVVEFCSARTNHLHPPQFEAKRTFGDLPGWTAADRRTCPLSCQDASLLS